MEVLLKKNHPHVVTILNKEGTETEPLDFTAPINVYELAQGLAELNKSGITLLDISAGVSKEGVTKIANVSNINQVVSPIDLPEETVIPFKSDSWALGEFIVRYKTEGKTIPRKFLKSQTLLDKFSGDDDEMLKKLLVLDPEKRAFTWEVAPPDTTVPNPPGCLLM
jgi:hypothetical protein